MVFGMARDFGGKPWSWFHYAAVAAAAAVNKPDAIVFWYEHLPSGKWWRAARPHLTLRKIVAPVEVFGNELCHPAHQADVVRLRALLDEGGAYIDSDVWCLKPFAGIQHPGWWMGIQGSGYGLCNATMGGDAGSAFAAEWLDTYRRFRSKGRDRHWDEHSVRVPLTISKRRPKDIRVLPRTAFFSPLWGRLREIFAGQSRHRRPHLADSYSVHLWESICWDYLSTLEPDAIDRRSEIGIRLQEIGVL